jgi:hypothetical protein
MKLSSQSKEDPSDCHFFKASDVRSSRNRAQYLDERGVFAACCARHGYPLICVDLFSGERYEYSDFVLAVLFQKYPNATRYNIFYDVACQYRKKFEVSLLKDCYKCNEIL